MFTTCSLAASVTPHSIADITAAVRSLPGKAAADRRFTLVVKADAILSVEEEEEVRVRAGQRVL